MKLKPALMLLVVAVSVVAPLAYWHRLDRGLRAKRETLAEQERTLAQLRSGDLPAAPAVDDGTNSRPLSGAELSELLKLRNEFNQLNRALAAADKVADENRRIRDAVVELDKRKESGQLEDDPLALLADELPKRQARVARLRQWLENHPEENIPELRLLPEESWAKSANWEPVTDEEFAGWMSAQRGNAQNKFSSMMFKALKNYGHANGGQFPAAVAQLQPYFETPVDEAIFDEYEIVPAKSLIKFLAEAGGDQVITQKSPVNRLDMRVAVSMTDHRGTGEEGRWDPVAPDP